MYVLVVAHKSGLDTGNFAKGISKTNPWFKSIVRLYLFIATVTDNGCRTLLSNDTIRFCDITVEWPNMHKV
jgi:hypothetical protein